MPICPVCDTSVDADQAAFEYHVNNHFVESAGTSSMGGQRSREGSMKRGREESLVAYVLLCNGYSLLTLKPLLQF